MPINQKLTSRQTLTTSANDSVMHVVQGDSSYKQTKANLLKEDRQRITNLEQNQYSGVEVYTTFADLPATGTLLVSYKVANDSDSNLLGFWHWGGSAYIKDATLEGLIGYDLIFSTDDFNNLITSDTPDGNWLIINNVVLDANKTLPQNTNLIFNGGIISGSFTLTGNNASIHANVVQIFENDTTFAGTWNIFETFIEWWGVGIDGSVNSAQAIERASYFGGTMYFPDAILIDRKVVITNDVSLNGSSTNTVISSSISGTLFESNTDKFEIKNFNYTATTSTNTFVDVVGSASYINLAFNTVVFKVNEIANYLVEVASGVNVTKLDIRYNDVNNATLLFADNMSSDIVNCNYNIINNAPRFVFRANNGAGATGVVNIFNVRKNQCYNINGNLTDKSQTARFFMSQGNYCEIESNLLDGAESTTASNFAYIKKGNYRIYDNNIKGIKSIDSVSIIDDKGTNADQENYMMIYNNVFDQKDVSFADTPEACIRINESSNISVYNNKFLNLKSYAFRVYCSVDTGNYPQNCSFYNNEIYNIDFPVPIQVFQNIKNTSIYDNVIHEISNTTAIAIGGVTRTENRIVDIYQTFMNGDDLENVLIQNNTVYNSVGDCFMVTLWVNEPTITPALNSDIINVKILGNSIVKGSGTGYIVKTTGTTSEIDSLIGVDIFNNSGFSGMLEKSGGTPASGIRTQNNLIT